MALFRSTSTASKKDGTYSAKMEDFFDDYYETPASVAINNLIARLAQTSGLPELLNVEEHYHILKFCILSHLRAPNKINEIYLSQVRFVMTMTYMQLQLQGLPTDIDFTVNLNKDFFFMESIKSIQGFVKDLSDLNLHIYFHRQPGQYFVLPDQPVALHSTDQREFGSLDLKIYFPVTSNIIISFERGVPHDILTEVWGQAIEELNVLCCSRFCRYIACENEEYLRYFVDKHPLQPEPIQSMNPWKKTGRKSSRKSCSICKKKATQTPSWLTTGMAFN